MTDFDLLQDMLARAGVFYEISPRTNGALPPFNKKVHPALQTMRPKENVVFWFNEGGSLRGVGQIHTCSVAEEDENGDYADTSLRNYN